MIDQITIVGELLVDVTITEPNSENKLRLGGIAHAARGAWAMGQDYSIGAIAPAYLFESASSFLEQFGCSSFTELGVVLGAPNVMLIGDQLELGPQGYEDLLRDEKVISPATPAPILSASKDALVIPGKYNIEDLLKWLMPETRMHIDIAYDVPSIDALGVIADRIETLFISTSSELFTDLFDSSLSDLMRTVREIVDCNMVVKENRGGTRIIPKGSNEPINIGASLSETRNSVGVGDVFDAAFVSRLDMGVENAGWIASRVSAAYAQTTFPDTFKEYTERSLRLAPEQIKMLGGTSVPWEKRQEINVYLAAPDFSYSDTREIERVVRSLEYHNFKVRRPVKENGELELGSGVAELESTFDNDVNLLNECDLVFAIPQNRDAGTLVEVGLAIKANIPVITYDPNDEAQNTMVVAGSNLYSHSFSECLNAVFDIASRQIND
ncbi:MAG: nucleoside 2-deoxyribosyltransferase [Pseudomonadota bacterium]